MDEVETEVKLPPRRNVLQLHDYWMSDDGEDLWPLLEYKFSTAARAQCCSF